MALDNMDLASVRDFAAKFNESYDRLDFLINNAGIMAQPLQNSKDGFDVQFQTNHLAHFLLTSLLWDKLLATKDKGPVRVISHASSVHLFGCFSREQMEHPPFTCMGSCLFGCLAPCMGMPKDPWRRYSMSKLCNVLFGMELQRKIDAGGLQSQVLSLSCHPGYASTQLQYVAGEAGAMKGWEKMNRKNAQSAADGSLPMLMACVADVKGGTYFGPKSSAGKGPPRIEKPGGYANNKPMAEALWTYSEECCGIKFAVRGTKE
eukprot:TRINITY_DN37767_c0_g1_i1.p1 TRINITY_DN37767_c0_g1~~TRINITY_DN37767_c0_g1_i1.p1  ORF type:complete len:262 (-),score=51.93 TRINITY_DN37767_c0_g1_i1:213-998(-)